MYINLAKIITLVEKVAAYFAVGGVGVADTAHLPTPVRTILAAAGALAVIEDRRSAVGVLPPSVSSAKSTSSTVTPTPTGPTV